MVPAGGRGGILIRHRSVLTFLYEDILRSPRCAVSHARMPGTLDDMWRPRSREMVALLPEGREPITASFDLVQSLQQSSLHCTNPVVRCKIADAISQGTLVGNLSSTPKATLAVTSRHLQPVLPSNPRVASPVDLRFRGLRWLL